MRQRQEGGSYRYRERWVGPGIVILHEGGTVWVVVRGRLFKCNPGHIRLATNPESLGAELLNLQELETLYGHVRGSGGPHLDMTGAQLPPEGDPTVREDDDGSTSSPVTTASQPAAGVEPPGPAEIIEEANGNRTPVLEEAGGSAAPSASGDAIMTVTTAPGETSAITTAANTLGDSNFDFNSAAESLRDVHALRRSLNVEQRQAMARDDVPGCIGVPASLRRRLSGPVPYAE